MFSITSTIPSHHLRSTSLQIQNTSPAVSSLLENKNRFDTNPSMRLNEHYEKQLPIDNHKMDFLNMVKSCDLLLLRGAPGSGKSTRAPAYVLSEGGNDVRILCTEPRKVAAIMLAQQVAKEGCVKLTHDFTSCIGYAVRGAKCFPAAKGSLLYSTTGWAVNTIMLHNFTHIFVDEIHERLLDMDMLLLLLKKIINLRKIKIILMSADLNISFLTDYFKEFNVKSMDLGGSPLSSNNNHGLVCNSKKHAPSKNRRGQPKYWLFNAASDGCVICVARMIEVEKVPASSVSDSHNYTVMSFAQYGMEKNFEGCGDVVKYLRDRHHLS